MFVPSFEGVSHSAIDPYFGVGAEVVVVVAPFDVGATAFDEEAMV